MSKFAHPFGNAILIPLLSGASLQPLSFSLLFFFSSSPLYHPPSPPFIIIIIIISDPTTVIILATMSRRKQPNPNKVKRKSAFFSLSIVVFWCFSDSVRSLSSTFGLLFGSGGNFGLVASVKVKFRLRCGHGGIIVFFSPLRVAS